MAIWRYSRMDTILYLLSIFECALTISLAVYWDHLASNLQIGGLTLMLMLMVYNIIIISHTFTHTPWFNSVFMNSLTSMLNSFNIGQSVQIYQLTHVRNHHRYNNDQKAEDGKTKDTSSTYSDGNDNEHASLFCYAVYGAADTFFKVLLNFLSITRLFQLGKNEHNLVALLSRTPETKQAEQRQIRLDRAAMFAGWCLLLYISWQWTLMFYLPILYLAFALVNVQNYYEHFGAMPGNLPDSATSNSVSHYGKLYNKLTFNDGYHQEHHLRPFSHWSTMPDIKVKYDKELNAQNRIISPVPAIIGFLDSNRKLLHKNI